MIGSIEKLRREAQRCTRCPLYCMATQTVFGEGPTTAPMMLVGEQPGDQEDLQGRPFVGPAGRILEKAFAEAGIDRSKVYLTNAVKHFKNEPRGKRRIHKRPNAYEIERCKWWLDRELQLLKPHIVVALGATAARSLTGRPVAIEASRGRLVRLATGPALLVTVHPSLLLRIPDAAAKAREYRRFVGDLTRAAAAVDGAARRRMAV